MEVITDETVYSDLKLSIDDSAIVNLFGGANAFLNRSGRQSYSMSSYSNGIFLIIVPQNNKIWVNF